MRNNLTATKSFTYAGRALKAGDTFSASRADSRVLQAVGRATPAETYQTTAAVPEMTKDARPSEGLKVAELRAALAEKGIEIPEGLTLKADLAALLDSASDEADAK